ncbi:MAG: hypothetical protein AB7V50_01805 [Vampirovibrionia bacterium]
MDKEQRKVSFSQLVGLTTNNAAILPNKAGLYMICKKDKHNNNQVIFAGVTTDLCVEFNNQISKHGSTSDLLFCYTLTSTTSNIKTTTKALYHRVA